MTTPADLRRPATLYIAPLQVHSIPRRRARPGPSHLIHPSSGWSSLASGPTDPEMTPPPTPRDFPDEPIRPANPPGPTPSRFLRAFYTFHPDRPASPSTITLPLVEGDIILVHTVHTNGWADGTLLTTGARGWLPTNYCDVYDHESIRRLLDALLAFWRLLRGDLDGDTTALRSRDHMKDLVAGERTACLTRDTPIVRAFDVLRRSRKALLTDLSALVKISKQLQETASNSVPARAYLPVVDEMRLRVFKVVMRGVKFLDVYNNLAGPVRERGLSTVGSLAASGIPPTPPAEAVIFGSEVSPLSHSNADEKATGASGDVGSRGADRMHVPARAASHRRRQTSAGPLRPPTERGRAPLSCSQPGTPHVSGFISPSPPTEAAFSSTSRHVSGREPILADPSAHLASSRLHASHDAFLSHQGSFIGRLHSQSRFSADLLVTTQQSVTACRDLLRIVASISERDPLGLKALERAKNGMYRRMVDLVHATKDVFGSRSPSALPDEIDMRPDDVKRLMSAATYCVRAAGECVGQAKLVLERIGDFDFEHEELNISDLVARFPSAPQSPTFSAGEAGTPFSTLSFPIADPHSPTVGTLPGFSSVPPDPRPARGGRASESPRKSRRSDSTTARPRLEDHVAGERHAISPADCSPISLATFSATEFGVGSASTNATAFSARPASDTGRHSQASTRATTPEGYPPLSPSSSLGKVDSVPYGSQSTFGSDEPDARGTVKTFSHELIHGRDGQIIGGTLPALIEQLTTHSATPDSMFVSAFYLTFRLFATPVELAEALVDRFDHVADDARVACPVQLRVYNIFKGWLESHWRNECDSAALPVITAFATDKLRRNVPAVGERLLALAERVSATSGPLLPRLFSSVGKTNGSVAQYISPDAPMPAPVLSRTQSTALRNWKQGRGSVSMLDFDPLELARQLTINASRVFCSIMPEELLGQEWTKKSNSMAAKVRAMSTLSTDLATLVSDSILEVVDVKRRAAVVKQWVKIAKRCLELNNYDTLMAIISALNSSGILRLKKTWDALSSKTRSRLEELRSVMDVARNYAVLRQQLQNHVPPCLPFVGIYLTDLTFIDVGNQITRQLQPAGDQREGISVINFDKHMKTAKIIGELQRFQIPYRLSEVPELQEWLQAQIERVRSSDEINVQSHYRRSLLLEPRDPAAAAATTHYTHHFPSDSTESTATTTTTAPPSSSSVRDKFDLFAWGHHRARDDSAVVAVS
ncbi:MAG: hypothetical protein M1826_000729 [Phylliscum demangeonii]|nr:MAG: hypothetical protein M1826_000729 [Phylliscum demangeonii]